MGYVEAHARATAAMVEAAAIWAAEDIARMMAEGHTREEAQAVQNAHAAELQECLTRNIGRLTRLMVEPDAPSRLQ